MAMSFGTPIHYIGIFEPLMRPIVRSGALAARDRVGIPHREYEQPVHFVDCRSYLGLSGSPCLVEFRFAKLEEIPADHLPWGDLAEQMWAGGDSVPPLGGLASLVLFCGMFIRHYTDESAVSSFGVDVMARSEEIWAPLVAPELCEQRLAGA